jgi:two-component system NtrC family sensor kinase
LCPQARKRNAEQSAQWQAALSPAHRRAFLVANVQLVRTFADQAVIAIENARLLTKLDKRRAELRVTFDNIGDAVIMFGGAQRLVAWNRNFLQLLASA